MKRRSSILLGERHTSELNRFMAKGIDLVVVAAIYLLGKAIWAPLGVSAAAIFCSFQDGLGMGQSIGKRIIGLQVLEEPNGLTCAFKASFLRNLPFTIAFLFSALPLLWVLELIVTLPIVGLEVYLILMLDSGVRLGDVLANTLVVEYVEETVSAFPDA